MRPALRRGLFSAFLAVVAAAGLTWAFWPRPLPVDLAEIVRGPLVATVDDEAKTRVKDLFIVAAPLAGRIERIQRHAGDAVVADKTPLLLIRPAPAPFLDPRSLGQAEAMERAAVAAYDLAAADVVRAEADLELAETEYARTARLAANGAESQRDVVRARAEQQARRAALDSARAALRLRRHELDSARTALVPPTLTEGPRQCCIVVPAPVSGRVLRVLQESETPVVAGTPLMELGDPHRLEIAADLLSTDAVRIKPGAPVAIEGWGGPHPLSGHVRLVEPFGFTKISALGIEEQRVTVVIDFDDSPADYAALGHGYRVDVRVVVWKGDDLLKAPAGGLFRVGDHWCAFVLDGGRARLRRVSVGHSNAREFEVLDGLAEHDRIVLHPSDRIADGRRIESRP